jgi:hypothetical protein
LIRALVDCFLPGGSRGADKHLRCGQRSPNCRGARAANGEIVVRNAFLSVEPAMRGWTTHIVVASPDERGIQADEGRQVLFRSNHR